jgi:Leucine-rich repeat (LRR) protein
MKYKVILSILVTLIVFPKLIQGAIPASERAALIALYNSTNGDAWSDHNGWKTPPLHTDGFAMPGTEDRWEGVTISENHVVALQLSQNQLMGSIPTELCNLGNLYNLDLHKNFLSGPIPSQLGNLRGMKWLDLSNNQLSGCIPPQLGNLNILLQLDLSSNQLSGSIPPELGNADSLTWLRLRFNKLSNSIPLQLGNLINLGFLDLSGNQLSGEIPSELGNLSNLSVLFLGSNHLSGEIPSSFLNLTQITVSYLDLGDNCLTATDPGLIAWLDIYDPDWNTTQDQCEGKTAKINLSHSRLYFGAVGSEGISNAQTVLLSNSGNGSLNWSASNSSTWLSFDPSSGTGDSLLSVSVDPSGLAVGSYTGAIIVTDPNAANSPQSITVLLHVYDQGQTSAPFGEFATPLDGAAVSGSIPVTGWILDDIEVVNVKIYNGDAYIGDALFVEGARPDVETAYPEYPNNFKSGWGYMLLTNCLPNGGNGTYTLIAKAIDIEGNEVTLGSKTITIDNAYAVKPFGALDTPIQGGTASGKKFKNNGWVITPQPNMIPEDGSTINVVIDGVVIGHPKYNIYRWDIAWFFPGYANSDGAAGYYYIDTTKLKNGFHTIAWVATDTEGNSDGIGSRYFTVQNSGNSGIRGQDSGIRGKSRGEPPCSPAFGLSASTFDETKIVEIKELERVEINLSDNGVIEGYSVVGDGLRDLPIGSTLDKENSIFYWQPGPGFIGKYRFIFIEKDNEGQFIPKNIVVNIKPKQQY